MVYLEKDISVALQYSLGVLLEQISDPLNEIYESSCCLSVMVSSRGKLTFYNVKSLES